jgi:hypothetical protein
MINENMIINGGSIFTFYFKVLFRGVNRGQEIRRWGGGTTDKRLEQREAAKRKLIFFAPSLPISTSEETAVKR